MAWRYENPGYRELLVVPGHTVECDSTKSKTGYAFWQNYQSKSFDIPSVKEIWVKFDVYSASGTSNRWRAYQDNGNYYYDGITRLNDQINIWTSQTNTGATVFHDVKNWAGLHTIILHMVSDASNGIVEYFLDGEKAASATGKNVNNGNAFNNFYLESDGADVLFSNVIISDTELTTDDTCDLSKKPWIQPVIGKNGTFGVDDFAVRRSDSSSNIYKVFDATGTNYGSRAYIDFYIKENVSIKSVCVSNVENNTNSSFTGCTLSSSDDGNTFDAIKTTNKDSSSTYTIFDIDGSQPKHYYRIYMGGNYALDGIIIHAESSKTANVFLDTSRRIMQLKSALSDTSRKIGNTINVSVDTKRNIGEYHNIDFSADTERVIKYITNINNDTSLSIVRTVSIDNDINRIVNIGDLYLFDVSLNVYKSLSLSVDLSRDTGKTSFDADATRKLYKIVAVPVDTVRRIPHDLFGTKEPVFENQDTFTPFPQNVTKGAEKGIIDFKLVLEENTLSDKISADVIGYEYWPGDIIKGTFIDYPYEMKIESTQNTGARQTINAMHYKDRLLYTGMHYDGYHLYELNRNRNASYRYMLRAQWYVNRIKESLSLHVDSRFSNFTPESNFSDTDITYADLLSGLFGWSSQYPWRLVNVFLRGNTLYILQRGRENSVYDITNLPHTEPQIERSIYYSPYASNNKNNRYTSSRIKVPHDPMLDVKDPDDPDKPDEPDDSEYKDPNDGDTDQSVEVRFSGTIMGDHISQTYSNGLCVKEVHTVDAYDEMGRKYEKIDVIVERDYDGDDRCTYEQTNNADGTWRKTDTSYTSDGGVGLGSHSHTEDGDEYGVVQTSDTYTAYLGSGFTCTSTYVDGQFVSSSISGSGISNRTIPYTQNQQNAALKQGAASSDDNDDDSNASRASRSSDAKTDPYIPTVDHSIRKQIQSEIDAYDRSVQETVSLEIIMPVIAGKPTMTHIIDFTERIKFNGAEYYLVRNTVDQTVSSLKQSIEITRWIRR